MILYHDILFHIEIYDIIYENEVKVRNDIILINLLLILDSRISKNYSTCDIHSYEMLLNISSKF